ncbi:MAG: acyl-CoA transferase [Alphaproteobacteria bacterium]
MATKRERVLSAFFSRLGSIPDAAVVRNEALPVRIPDGGLVVMRDGDAGQPDITLNPRAEYYAHRIMIEVITIGDATALDTLLIALGNALAGDETLGGLAEMLTILAPEVGMTPVENAATLRHATVPVVVEYQVTGPLREE